MKREWSQEAGGKVLVDLPERQALDGHGGGVAVRNRTMPFL